MILILATFKIIAYNHNCTYEHMFTGAIIDGRRRMKGDNNIDISEINTSQMLEAAEIFKILGDDTRMRIICLLLKGSHIVSDLASSLDLSNSAVSHQLRILRQARLVKYKRKGRTTRYELADKHVEDIIALTIMHIGEDSSYFASECDNDHAGDCDGHEDEEA